MDAETLQATEDTVMIVDDEPLMTELFEKFMSRRGLRVLTADSGEQALRLARQEGARIRLVLTDMTMPVMDGLTLARELGQMLPDVPVMLATGHDADMETARGLPNVVAVVRKPYQNRVLVEQIREIIGNSHSRGTG